MEEEDTKAEREEVKPYDIKWFRSHDLRCLPCVGGDHCEKRPSKGLTLRFCLRFTVLVKVG